MADSTREVGVKKIVLSIFLFMIGMVVGITIVSDFLPFGRAVNEPEKIKPPVILQTEQTFVQIAKAVTPAVVNISTTRRVKREELIPGLPFNNPLFREFFGDEHPRRLPGKPKEHKEPSLGSGVIVDASGLIITNNHVIANADEIKVLLGDRREFKGTVVGTDPRSDIAVLKIDAKDLPVIPWGDSTKLQVGEYVLTVGNPFGLNQTVTMGIVSAVGRANVGIADYEDFVQTDAAINPGNSGGAMVNTHGELVGINTAIFTQSGGYMGIGFAVPSNMARSVMESLVRTGKVTRGWFGISIQEVTPQLAEEFGLKETRGALVADVLPGSPAEKAGIKRGDVVVSFMGQKIENSSQLRNTVAQADVGTQASVVVIRAGKEKGLSVKVEEQPKDIAKGPVSPEDKGSTLLAGIEVKNMTPELIEQFGLGKTDKGVVVTWVDQESMAEAAGLQRGDLIMEMNRSPIRDTGDYERAVSKIKKGTSALLLVSRQGRSLFISIKP